MTSAPRFCNSPRCILFLIPCAPIRRSKSTVETSVYTHHDLFGSSDRPDVSDRFAEWRPCIQVKLDVVLTNVQSASVRVHQFKPWRVVALDRKPVCPESFTFADSLTRLLEIYRAMLMQEYRKPTWPPQLRITAI